MAGSGGTTVKPRISERMVVLLIAAVHFINVLDFIMVIPLGPDFSRALKIPVSDVGYIAGSYTFAAAISGLIASTFLDRFDRRRALAVAMLGLMSATLACGFAWNFESLMAARILAGCFGGPAASLSMAIIADVIPPQRRGRAMGVVMGAFSIASVLGIPIGLELASRFAWNTPFFCVAALGAVVAAAGLFFLPPMRIHFTHTMFVKKLRFWEVFTHRLPLLAYAGMVCMVMSMFLIIPNLPVYMLNNLGYKGEGWLDGALASVGAHLTPLGALYLFGGIVNLTFLLVFGRLTDRLGSTLVGALGNGLLVAALFAGFVSHQPWMTAPALFIVFMASGSLRGVAMQTLNSKVPRLEERAGFMSALSSVQHFFAGVGQFVAAKLTTQVADGPRKDDLVGMSTTAAVAIGFAVLATVMIWVVDRGVRKRAAAMRVAPGEFPVEPAS
ncbi:MAG: MFS transporter [Planctomycetes bacterium]|nr:MFS transporter [Planctomycetota bacterium]